jgi:hypothetical protein
MMAGPPVPFSQLPLNKEVPNTKLNAWGAYGKDDEKGFLNRQTDEIVKKAAESEIKTGKRYFRRLVMPAAILIAALRSHSISAMTLAHFTQLCVSYNSSSVCPLTSILAS